MVKSTLLMQAKSHSTSGWVSLWIYSVCAIKMWQVREPYKLPTAVLKRACAYILVTTYISDGWPY